MRTRAKKLPLDKKECETVSDWYMFVETPQRTSIDNKFNTKVTRAINKKTTHNNILISVTEAQIIGRWYLMIPNRICDNLDNKIYKTLERFIDQSQQ